MPVSAATVSVVIPVCNGAAHLGATLEAVQAQWHPAHEVIVVDDGSDDDSALIARAHGVTLLQQPRSGVCSARNHGLAQASGEWVAFLDQDDLWHPQHLQRQLQAAALAPEAGVVVSPYRHWYPQGRDGPQPPADWLATPPPLQLLPEHSGWVYHAFMEDCWALTSATLLRRSLLQQCGAFDTSLPFSEDWELWLRLSRHTRFAALNAPAVLYRQHPSQGSRLPRAVDYRTELLLRHEREHGLCSADGRCLDRRRFRHTLAGYHLAFGYRHLQQGDPALGRQALWQAWRADPRRARALALIAASCLGWRPRPPSPDA